LKGDIVAGITVGAMVIPQGLAYAALAGLPPVIGLYTSFFTLLTYSFFGTCGQLSVAPDAMTAILVRSFLAELEGESGEAKGMSTGSAAGGSNSSSGGYFEYVEPNWSEQDSLVITSGLSLISGLILLLLGVVRAGFIDNVLSRAVLRGFVTAAAIIIVIEQLPVFCSIFLPVESLEWHAHDKLLFLLEHFGETHWLNFFIGVGGVGFLYAVKFLKPRFKLMSYVPEVAILVMFGILFAFLGDYPKQELPVLGSFGNAGFHKPHLPAIAYLKFSQVQSLIPAALVISLIGFVESIVCVKELTAKHHYLVSSNRELFALGASNFVASFFQSFPAFGSLPRSFVNHAAGARSPLSSFLSAMIVAIIILFLLPVFSYLPKVIMASIIIVAAIALIEVQGIPLHHKLKLTMSLKTSSSCSKYGRGRKFLSRCSSSCSPFFSDWSWA
jgi:SulP family sulfate permease